MQRTQASDTVSGARAADRARHGRSRRERWHRVRFTAQARWRGGCARSTGRARRSVRSISGRSRCAPRSAPASIAPSPSCSGGDPTLPFFTTTNTRRSSDLPNIRPRSASAGRRSGRRSGTSSARCCRRSWPPPSPPARATCCCMIDRGYLEEAYFSFSYSPIHGEDGAVVGVFCPVIETTEKVIGERRLRTLRDLAARTKGAATEDEAYAAAAATLAENPQDVPVRAALSGGRSGHGGRTAWPRSASQPGEATAPERVTLGDAGDRWLMESVAASGQSALLTDLRTRFEALPAGAWKMSPASALVLPVLLPGPGSAAGHSGGGGEPDARARRRLPDVLRARRHARLPPGSPTPRRSRRSGGGPRAWRSWIAPRPRSSPTSPTSSARR